MLELQQTLSEPLMASIGQIVPSTEAEGPGKRYAIWFQGCPLRCPGCCNPQFLAFKAGHERSVDDVIRELQTTHREQTLEGITLLGGEPFAHAIAANRIATAARELGLSVMAFTGFILEELHAKHDPQIESLIAKIDLLVDGPYQRELPDTTRRWIGSTNQRIHFLSGRYSANDAYWRESNTLEIRVDRDGISVNGFPAPLAAGLWKGWHRPNESTQPLTTKPLPRS